MDVLVGTIGRPHGIKGAVVVHLRTDEPEQRFARGAVVRLDGGGDLTVAHATQIGSAFVVQFAGVPDRSAAERYRGEDLWAEIADGSDPSEADVFHDTRLIGLDVRDESGARRGVVVRVEHLPAQDVLVVDAGGGERLVPFVHTLVPDVCVADGFVTIADVPGLLDDGAIDAR
ncbi:MAG: ribosome maturation factor RimM [Micrococcales bacterium]|nr:ribosome maturation factor RimM [Micrococcales bacterium]